VPALVNAKKAQETHKHFLECLLIGILISEIYKWFKSQNQYCGILHWK